MIEGDYGLFIEVNGKGQREGTRGLTKMGVK
jgi:hypothetical protein